MPEWGPKRKALGKSNCLTETAGFQQVLESHLLLKEKETSERVLSIWFKIIYSGLSQTNKDWSKLIFVDFNPFILKCTEI